MNNRVASKGFTAAT